MGNENSFLIPEKATWSEHTPQYDENARLDGLALLDLYKDGDDLHYFWIGRHVGPVMTAHYYVTNLQYVLGFGVPEEETNVYDERVVISRFPKNWKNQVQVDVMNKEIRKRMRHVLGLKNYSMCLRNSEHVARYVICGDWASEQMQEPKGLLLARFRPYMSGETRLAVNTFPSSDQTCALSTTGEPPKTLYSFTKDHYSFSGLDYYLDYDDDTYNVLMVGPTGTGKSHLINVLFNQKVCKSEANHRGVSRDVCFIRGKGQVYDFKTKGFKERDVVVTDTIGFCDTELKDEEAISMVRHRVSSNCKNIDAVYVVFKADRLLKDFVKNVKTLLDWLGYHNGDNYLRFVFVGTHAEFLTEEKKAEMSEQAKEIFGLKNVGRESLYNGENYNSLVYVGFPPEEALSPLMKAKVEESWRKVSVLIKLPGACPRLTAKLEREFCTIL